MPKVATSATIADGTAITIWPANMIFAPPAQNAVVLGKIAAQGWANIWTLASKLLPNDDVYTDTPNPASPSTNWWPVSAVNFGVPVTTANPVVTLNWKAPTTNEDGTALTNLAGFNIYRGTVATALVKIASVGAAVLSYQDKGLKPGTYFYDITAFNTDTPPAESAPSTVASTTITSTPPPKEVPGMPTSLSISVTVTAVVP